MRIKYQRPGYLLVSGLALFSSCQRESLKPDGLKPEAIQSTSSALLSSRLGMANPFVGSPNTFPVSMAFATTFTGTPTNRAFREPTAVATDASGNVYAVDQDNNLIKKFDRTAKLVAVWGGGAGYQDGAPLAARFNTPAGIAVAPNGQIFVADMNNNRIRVISADGKQVSTFAGSGRAAFNDGQGTLASFNQPVGIAVDAAGTVYIADYGNNMIRKITPSGGVTRWVGQTNPGSADGTGSLASFNHPTGITIAPDGKAYVADFNNNKIRKIYSGTVTTLAGNAANQPGPDDGTGTSAKFNLPYGIACDPDGNLYVTDKLGNSLRTITPAGVVRTVAGGVTKGYNDSYDINAQFNNPEGIAIDYAGNMFVADRFNQVIRRVDFVRAVKTLAGNGNFGYREGGGFGAIIESPMTVATGTDGNAYIMDVQGRIRKITPDGITSLVAGDGMLGFRDGPAASAEFNNLSNIAVGRDGTIYVADGQSNRIRKIANGVVSTLAGNGQLADRDGTGTQAAFVQPEAIAMGPDDNIYVATFNTGRICRITPAGVVTTVCRLPLNTARQGYPLISAMTIDAAGHKYLASPVWNTLYEITADNQAPIVLYGGLDNRGNALKPTFLPQGLAFDPIGRLYISERSQIEYLVPGSQVLVGIAGSTDGGNIDAPVFDARFRNTTSIALSPAGVIYITDAANNKVRVMSKP